MEMNMSHEKRLSNITLRHKITLRNSTFIAIPHFTVTVVCSIMMIKAVLLSSNETHPWKNIADVFNEMYMHTSLSMSLRSTKMMKNIGIGIKSKV